MTAYADTSVLVSAFTRDDHTPRARAWLAGRPSLIISGWALTEFGAVVRRQARMGRLSRQGVAEAEVLLGRLAADPAAFRPVLAEDVVAAHRLVRDLEPLRAPDAVHLAIAIRLQFPIATFDEGLSVAAAAAGVGIVDL